MLLDKETVYRIMDKSDKNYQDYLFIMETIPEDAVFELYNEDKMYAQYFNKNNEYLFIPILFDYFNCNNSTNIKKDFIEDEDEFVNRTHRISKVKNNSRINIISILIKNILFYIFIGVVLYSLHIL